MKIMVYGSTETAYRIALDLYESHDVTIIDDIEEIPERFAKLDLSFVSGTPSDIDVLESSGVRDADVFIACCPLDEANIVASWAVKKFAQIETVCFVSKMEYYKSFANMKGGFQFSDIGIDYIIWPEEALVQTIFRIITVPEAIDVEYFEGGKARLLEYKIKEDSLLLNKELKDCDFPESTLVVGVTRKNELFIPNGFTKLELGDKAIFMGADKALNMLSRKYFLKKDDRVENVAILGGGNVGFMLAKRLEDVGIRAKIIEINPERCELLADKLQTTLVINADATNIEIFDEEELGDSDVVMTVTNNDEKNLLASLLAKQKGVPKVFARVSSESMIDLFERVGVDVTLSPKEATLNELKNKVLDKHTNILAVVERGQGGVIEMTVPHRIHNTPVKNIDLPRQSIIGIVRRGHKIIVPRGDTVLKHGDIIIVFTMADNVSTLKEFFHQ